MQSRYRFAWAALALALPISALADLSQTTTLVGGTGLNLDTGAVTSSGDILWSANSITAQNNARAINVGPVGSLAGLTKATLDPLKGASSLTPIPSSTLVVGDVFAVFTNGGNTAGVLVTGNSGGSITLQFTTFGVSGGGGGGGGGGTGPTITNVLNNSSLIPAGFPNSGIAQGSLFQILGSGLADSGDATLHDSQAAGGLPTTLSNASITVTSGATVVHPALYYSTPTQIDAVLPSSTPTGAATVTVTYKGTASNVFQIQVVAAAPGITVYNGSGIAQHALTAQLVTYTSSAAPGEVLIIWGTGFGATGNSDTAYDTSGHQTGVSYGIYVGGVLASVAYAGASVYPGVDVFGITIPANAPTGCYVPIAAVANGNIVSNVVTLPINAGGGTCSDPQLGYSGDQISTLNGRGSVKSGFLIVSQFTAPGLGTLNSASASFQQTSGVTSSGGGTVSIGGCILTQTLTGGSPGTTTGLNAGTITVAGPGGSQVTLSANPLVAGFYTATLSSIPSTGGAYVFTSTAGSQVGSFSATVSFPNPLLSWTNQSSAATIARTQGLPVTWSGGASGSFVIITGSSVSGTTSGGFFCIVPQSAGQFTVPSYILLGLPAGTGSTSVQNSTNFTPFLASGLDFGGAVGSVALSVSSTFN